jgi:hypothetical protein
MPISHDTYQRLLEERSQLADRTRQLGEFIGDIDTTSVLECEPETGFNDLSPTERQLLQQQYSLMTAYLAVLDQRIENNAVPQFILDDLAGPGEVARGFEEHRPEADRF